MSGLRTMFLKSRRSDAAQVDDLHQAILFGNSCFLGNNIVWLSMEDMQMILPCVFPLVASFSFFWCKFLRPFNVLIIFTQSYSINL